jgi:hypothetical protein
MKTHYVVHLFNSKQETWTYTDDYYRPVKFSTEKEAEEQIKDIFSWGADISSAKIIQVTEDEVAYLDNTDEIQNTHS